MLVIDFYSFYRSGSVHELDETTSKKWTVFGNSKFIYC